jgi:hypothetical protein
MRTRTITIVIVLLILSSALTASASYENYAPIPKTGQTTSYDTRDDGALQMGVTWPSQRFTDNSDGTVTDNLTGLIWLKHASCFGQKNWTTALNDANTLASGSCGLTDGSSAGDWRLPNVRELFSLIDFSQDNPALPSGYATYFTNVQSSDYWSSSTSVNTTSNAWWVGISYGYLDASHDKATTEDYVWPVRGESAPADCPTYATGGATEPFKPMALFGPWLLLVAAVASVAITAIALKRRAV